MVDKQYREWERNWSAGDKLSRPPRASYIKAFSAYKRLGWSPKDIHPSILYAGTDHALLTQEPIDFRSLLTRIEPSVYGGIRFNHNLSISIQASGGHYSNPRRTLPSPYDYLTWEFYFCPAPESIKHYYFEEDDEDDDYDEDDEFDLEAIMAAVKLHEEDPYSKVIREEGEAMVIIQSRDYTPGGILHGMPHQSSFRLYDEGIGPYVALEHVQDIFDFLRARFGLEEFDG
jgi:hypothetical protein